MPSLIESLNAGSGRWIAFGAALGVQTCFLFALLFVLDLLLRRRVRASLRHAFWLLFLVKLVLPPSLSFPTGAGYWLAASQATPLAPAPTAPVRTETRSEFTPLPHTSSVPTDSLRRAPRSGPSLRPSAWLLLAWLAGASGLLVCFIRRLAQQRRVVARSVSAPASVQLWLERGRTQLMMRDLVHIRLSDDVRSPALCGLRRPVVLLPSTLADKLGPSQLRAVVLHELIHLQRGDLWIQSLQALLQIVYWWHPLVWAANIRIRLAREEAVDDRVMRELGAEGESYPATLLELAKAALPIRFAGLSLLGILDAGGGLRGRIQRLLESAPPARPRLGWTGLIWTLLLGMLVLPMRGQVRFQSPALPDATDKAPKVVAAVYDALYDPQRDSRDPKPVLGQAEVETVLGPSEGSKGLVLEQAVKILRTAGYVPGSIIGLDGWFMEHYGKTGAQMIENASLVIAGRSNSLHGVVDFYEPPAADQARRADINRLNQPRASEHERLRELLNRFTEIHPSVIQQRQRIRDLEARSRSRAFHVDPDLFLRNLQLRRGETIRAASDNPMDIFLDLLKGAGVDCTNPSQHFFNRETGTIILWNSAEGLAAGERVILGLNQPDGRASSYAPPAGTNPSILAEATILQITDADFTRLRLGEPPEVAQQIGDFWHLGSADWNAVRNRARDAGMTVLTRPRIQTSPGVTARLFIGGPQEGGTFPGIGVETVPYLSGEQIEVSLLVQTTGHFSPAHPADWPDARGWTNVALHGRVTLNEGDGVVLRAHHPGPNPTNNLVVLFTARVLPRE